MCHTDLHYLRDDWGISIFPLVPGHEITGVVIKARSNVSEFKVEDKVGVGCLAASCLNCEFCDKSEENYCEQVQFTYSGIFWDGSITYGGYSEMLVANKSLGKSWLESRQKRNSCDQPKFTKELLLQKLSGAQGTNIYIINKLERKHKVQIYTS